MPFRRVDAKYSHDTSEESYGGEVAMLRILTAHGKIQLHLSDGDYRSVIHAIADARSDALIDSTYTSGGEFIIEPLPPSHDNDASVVVKTAGARVDVAVDSDELGRIERVMKHAHPDFEDYPDVIEGVA